MSNETLQSQFYVGTPQQPGFKAAQQGTYPETAWTDEHADTEPLVDSGEALPAPELHEFAKNASELARAVRGIGKEAVETYFHGSNYPFSLGEKVVPGSQAILGEDGVLHASAAT